MANNTVHNNSPNAAFEPLSKGESWESSCPWPPLRGWVSSLEEAGFNPSASPSALSGNAGPNSRCLQAEQNAGDCLSLALWQRGGWFQKSFPLLRFSAAQFSNHSTESKTRIWVGPRWFRLSSAARAVPGWEVAGSGETEVASWEHTQQCHQVTGVWAGAVAKSQDLHKPNPQDLISPKENTWDFALLLSWALRIKATAAVTRKWWENQQAETPVALSSSCVSWKVCLASLLVKGIQSYHTGLPWRHFISAILNFFWKEGQGQRCACQMQINSR